jgi:hypothetical protein
MAIWLLVSLLAAQAAAGTGVPAPASQQEIALAASDEAALRERVTRWWDARGTRDHQQMYDLYEPGYRATVPLKDFLGESAVRARFELKSHRIAGLAALSADEARVTVKATFAFPRFPGDHPVDVEETWVRRDGDWYKVYQPFQPPFPTDLPK